MDIKSKKIRELMFLIAFGIILYWGLNNFSVVKGILFNIFKVLKPVIMGFVIAFLFNEPMTFIENKLGNRFGQKISSGNIRLISYIITLIFFILVIGIITFIIVPSLVETSKQLAEDIPVYWERLEKLLGDNENFKELTAQIDFDSIYAKTYDFFKNRLVSWINSTFLFVSGILSSIVSFFLSFILSVYMLLQKDTLKLQVKKLIYALIDEERANELLDFGEMSKNTFSKFLTGQITEAFILGSIFFIVMLVFRIPYAPIVSVAIGITSLIPTVGAFIGCFIGILLITVENYKKTLLFVVLFLLIQQIEGNFIYPKVVGKASGLSPFWVTIAITIGGSLMGVLGIILFVPLFSIISKVLAKFVENRLEEKNIIIKN